MIESIAITIGYGIMCALGLIFLILVLYILMSTTAFLLVRYYKHHLLSLYKMEQLRRHMMILENLGAKGLRRAQAQQRERGANDESQG